MINTSSAMDKLYHTYSQKTNTCVQYERKTLNSMVKSVLINDTATMLIIIIYSFVLTK